MDDFAHVQVEVVSTRAARERIIERLFRQGWPDGGADRLHPTALRWTGLWRPMRTGRDVRQCGCATGQCEICN